MLYQYFFVLNRYFLFIHCHKQGMRLVMEKAAVYLRISKEDKTAFSLDPIFDEYHDKTFN